VLVRKSYTFCSVGPVVKGPICCRVMSTETCTSSSSHTSRQPLIHSPNHHSQLQLSHTQRIQHTSVLHGLPLHPICCRTVVPTPQSPPPHRRTAAPLCTLMVSPVRRAVAYTPRNKDTLCLLMPEFECAESAGDCTYEARSAPCRPGAGSLTLARSSRGPQTRPKPALPLQWPPGDAKDVFVLLSGPHALSDQRRHVLPT